MTAPISLNAVRPDRSGRFARTAQGRPACSRASLSPQGAGARRQRRGARKPAGGVAPRARPAHRRADQVPRAAKAARSRLRVPGRTRCTAA